MERVLGAIVAVLLVVDVLVVLNADGEPARVAIDAPTVADVTPSPLESSAPTADVTTDETPPEAEPSATPTPTPTPTGASPAEDVPPAQEAPPAPEDGSAAGPEYGPAVFTTTVTTDGRHYYDGETVHITVEVCNPEDHAVRRQYFRHEPARVFVIDYWHDWVASVGLTEETADEPVRRETWSPRECRTYDYEWTLWAGPAENPRGRAREGTFRIDAEAHGYNDPRLDGNATRPGYSAWFGHHHGPRPDEEPPPPPDDHSEQPGFSLSVATDGSSYAEGETVHTSVTACNETGQEQRHRVTADPPLTVRYRRTGDGGGFVAYQGQQYDQDHDGTNTYESFEISFGPNECRTYDFAWDQTWNDGRDDGRREPGTYEVEADWQADWTGRPEGHDAAMYAESPRFELR